jgi:thiamine biosynthesis protein ThiI
VAENPRVIVVHYGELGLKKGNRDYFEKRLCRNIDLALRGCNVGRARRISGRLLVGLEGNASEVEVRSRLSRIFGIAWFGEARIVRPEIDAIADAVWTAASGVEFASFRIDTRRPDKRFPMTSVEVNRIVGAFVQERSRARVDLDHAELVCRIELVDGMAVVSVDRFEGAGGLPTGTGGKVLVLLSGGIDSPVAAFRIARRGARAVFVHFHSAPHTNRESQEKAVRIARILAGYQLKSKVYMVPFVEIQKRIMVETPVETRVILYRRFMMRLAERIALGEKARVLVTGDSLGQVASQTLENLDVVSRAVRMPILRPLVGSDKQEIVSMARSIGTYEISILPDQDCCSLFIPRHPETRARLEQIEGIEARIDLAAEMEAALASAEVLLQYPAYEAGAVRQF